MSKTVPLIRRAEPACSGQKQAASMRPNQTDAHSTTIPLTQTVPMPKTVPLNMTVRIAGVPQQQFGAEDADQTSTTAADTPVKEAAATEEAAEQAAATEEADRQQQADSSQAAAAKAAVAPVPAPAAAPSPGAGSMQDFLSFLLPAENPSISGSAPSGAASQRALPSQPQSRSQQHAQPQPPPRRPKPYSSTARAPVAPYRPPGSVYDPPLVEATQSGE